MVTEQLVARGIRDERLLAAMRKIPRHLFVPEHQVDKAYTDNALPIGYGVTISQPLMVAAMTELLNVGPGMKALEIGAGSGYQAAILAELGAEVVTIEKIEPVAEMARRNLSDLGYDVKVVVGDGSLGWPEDAPYDRIIFTASAPSVPERYIDQLAAFGRIVGPVGSRQSQELIALDKSSTGETVMTYHGGCMFIPMVGKGAWPEGTEPPSFPEDE